MAKTKTKSGYQKKHQYSKDDLKILKILNRGKKLDTCIQEPEIKSLAPLVKKVFIEDYRAKTKFYKYFSPFLVKTGGHEYVGYLFPPAGLQGKSHLMGDALRTYTETLDRILKIPAKTRNQMFVKVEGLSAVSSKFLNQETKKHTDKDSETLPWFFHMMPDPAYLILSEKGATVQDELEKHKAELCRAHDMEDLGEETREALLELLKGVRKLMELFQEEGLEIGDFHAVNMVFYGDKFDKPKLFDVYDSTIGFSLIENINPIKNMADTFVQYSEKTFGGKDSGLYKEIQSFLTTGTMPSEDLFRW